MGVLDMLNLVVFCMSDGFLSMIGAVFCSAPDFLYIKGASMMGMFFELLKSSSDYTNIFTSKPYGWSNRVLSLFSR